MKKNICENVKLELLIETNMISLEALHCNLCDALKEKKKRKIIQINRGLHFILCIAQKGIANCF